MGQSQINPVRKTSYFYYYYKSKIYFSRTIKVTEIPKYAISRESCTNNVNSKNPDPIHLLLIKYSSQVLLQLRLVELLWATGLADIKHLSEVCW